MNENHPIPQQISSYQFRLVGDMTLKQFFQLAGGALVGLLFYATPLHPFIKWPIIIFSCLFGAALAFLPFEERPLEKWIVAFFRSVYSPTIFNWNRGAMPKFFQDEQQTNISPTVIAPQGQEALNSYLAASQSPTSFFKKLEEGEKSFLNKMGDLFAPGSPAQGSVKIEAPTINLSTSVPKTEPIGASSQVASVSSPYVSVDTNQHQKTEVVTPETQDQTKRQGPVVVPRTDPITVQHTSERPKFFVEEKSQPVSVVEERPLEKPQAPGISPDAQKPIFSPDAAPPTPPTVPNTLTGQVMDSGGKIIQGAILEIRDISGRPVRALRTNMLGHFLVVTPLVNGTYEIITEKEGYNFEPVKFEAEGEIIDPIAIRAGQLAPVATPVAPNSTEFTSSQALQV